MRRGRRGTTCGGDHDRRGRPVMPSVSGTPAISVSRDEDPLAVAIRHPTPLIGRDKCPADIRVIDPRAVEKRIPREQSRVWTPTVSAARYIREASVVVKIRVAIIQAGGRLRFRHMAIAVIAALLVPVIVRRGIYVLREKVAIGIRIIQGESFSLTNLYLRERGAGHPQFTFEDCNVYAGRVRLNAEMRGVQQLEGLVSDEDLKDILLAAPQIKISAAILQCDFGNSLA